MLRSLRGRAVVVIWFSLSATSWVRIALPFELARSFSKIWRSRSVGPAADTCTPRVSTDTGSGACATPTGGSGTLSLPSKIESFGRRRSSGLMLNVRRT